MSCGLLADFEMLLGWKPPILATGQYTSHQLITDFDHYIMTTADPQHAKKAAFKKNSDSLVMFISTTSKYNAFFWIFWNFPHLFKHFTHNYC